MFLTITGSLVSAAGVKVAVVKSWSGNAVEPVFTELNNNWDEYGDIPLNIDTSLRLANSFTYEDLVNTDANVLWLSSPAGHPWQYSDAEVAAIAQYVSEGHSILGTYRVFQSIDGYADNRGLAPIFGLREDITYNTQIVDASQTFNILDANHPLFSAIDNPYISNGYPNAQVPADDSSWDAGDFGSATLLAQTADKRGVITWYRPNIYSYAVYISEMPEYNGSQTDIQFLYNALTVPEPATIVLLTLGGLVLFRRKSA